LISLEVGPGRDIQAEVLFAGFPQDHWGTPKPENQHQPYDPARTADGFEPAASIDTS
jgi:hypothetical protein